MPRALPAYFLLFLNFATVFAGDYGVPIEIQLWDTGRTPLDHMVDVANEFGLKVLAEHNFLNDNNIAFSPYGLTGIMVALFEGVEGESSYQIQRGMQLPWNRNVMRVGFRDIHRTLKTYFVPEEGFLAGLALNNENVTFNDSYRKTLRFYGFDLDSDKLPTLSPQPNNTTNNTDSTTAITIPAREETSSTTPEIEETTPRPSSEATDIDIRIPTTPSPSSAPNAISTTEQSTPAPQIASTTAEILETTTSAPTTSEPSTKEASIVNEAVDTTTATQTKEVTITTVAVETTASIQTNSPSTKEDTTTTVAVDTTRPNAAPTIKEATTTTEVVPDTTTSITTNPTMETTESVSTVNNEVEIISTPEASLTAEMGESTMSTTVLPETTQTFATTIAETDQTNDDGTTQTIRESTLETLDRKKKSIVDFIFTNPPYMQDLGYQYHRAFEIGPDFLGEKPFLVNGLRNMQVTYMHYDSILEHAYLPHLEASALRLPLDSDRYYLLVVLPTRTGPSELGRLIGRMARESDLRDVHAAMRPKRVRALVPSFTVKGHVTLTTDLQKLGIRDVFEPRQRDFTPMTSGSGVYVRSVEQAVSVAIRKYRPDEHKQNRYVSNRYPVHFSATYPFLYFVMDSSIHVALMAGKMVDPLNTRIL